MRYLKKVIPLKDKNSKSIGTAVCIFKDGIWQFKISLQDKPLSADLNVILWCQGFKRFKCLDFNFEGSESEISLAIFIEDGLSAFGKTPSSSVNLAKLRDYVEAEKENANADIKDGEKACYDDYAIAAENYYAGELIHELCQDDVNAERSAESGEGSQKEDCGDVARHHEASKGVGRRDKGEAVESVQDQRRGVFSEDKGRYFEKKREDFLKLFLENDRDNSLSSVILNCRFVRVEDREGSKYYLVGLLGEDFLTPSFILYAVPGKRGEKAEGFENAAFVPTDFFDLEKGYFVSFQSPDTGEKINSSFSKQ